MVTLPYIKNLLAKACIPQHKHTQKNPNRSFIKSELSIKTKKKYHAFDPHMLTFNIITTKKGPLVKSIHWEKNQNFILYSFFIFYSKNSNVQNINIQ